MKTKLWTKWEVAAYKLCLIRCFGIQGFTHASGKEKAMRRAMLNEIHGKKRKR
jgi:hypothetical protein